MSKLFFLFLAAFLCCAHSAAQNERPEMIRRPELVSNTDAAPRFELGQRLRAVEAAWDAQPDPATRKRAALLLKSAVTKFFSANPGDAGRALDQARFMLQGADVAPEKLWAESLYLKPASRLQDVTSESLAFTLERFYNVPTELPAGAQLRVELGLPNRKPVPAWQGNIKELPFNAALPLKNVPEGDFILHMAITVSGKVLAASDQTVSFVARLTSRLAQLDTKTAALPPGTDANTARLLWEIAGKLAKQESLETNYPAATLLQQAEGISNAVQQKRSALGNRRAGQFWLSLALGEKDALPVRVAAPDAAKTGQPLPLVIALHGAGGSENLFFDGYGRGAAVKLAQQRGWLIAAPRNFGVNPERLALFIDALTKLYPVDRSRIFLVGHSMGAMLAIALASNLADKLAGVAALGGGGRPRNYEDLKKVPFFVGVGTEDFTVNSVRLFKAALEQIGVERVDYREYQDVEHLAIVQVALPDVFTFFDEIAAKR